MVPTPPEAEVVDVNVAGVAPTQMVCDDEMAPAPKGGTIVPIP